MPFHDSTLSRRTPVHTQVLYEPSAPGVESDDELEDIEKRTARDVRRTSKAADAPLGNKNAPTNIPDGDRLARKAKTKMKAMHQSEAVKRLQNNEAVKVSREGMMSDTMNKPRASPVGQSQRAPKANTKTLAKASGALSHLNLADGTKTKKSQKKKVAMNSPTVDSESAAAVFGSSSGSCGKSEVIKTKATPPLKKVAAVKKPSPKRQVPAPTGSGAHKHQWDSFVDWKMMEHQDYETIPDSEFEKLSEKLHIKEKWRPMVSYLVSLGLTTKELEKCLVNCEEIFKRPVAKIMTRVEYLQNELGFEGAELIKLIHKEPKILLQRNRHSIPRCRYLTDLGISSEKLPSMLRKQPQILHLSVNKGLMPRVSYFKNELLIPECDIPKMLERNPAVLTFSIENQVKPRVEFLKNLGISHDGVMKMIVRHPHLLQYSFEGLEEHITFLSSIGMNEEDVVHTVTRLSQLFSLSVDNSLRPKFKYMCDELGGDVKTCVKFPAYFSLSLDQRIRPRHTYLQQYKCAPDPFPMKYLSENDVAFVKRSLEAGGSLEDFEEYKEVAIPKFKAETEMLKERAIESLHMEQRRAQMREARVAQQRRLQVQNQGYSQRIVDARNSMNRVKMLGVSRQSR